MKKKRKIWIACIAALVIAAAFMPVSALTATPAFAAGTKYDLPTKVTYYYYQKKKKKWKLLEEQHNTYEKGRLKEIYLYDGKYEDVKDRDDLDDISLHVTYTYKTRANGKLSKVVVRDRGEKKTFNFNKKGKLKNVDGWKVKHKKGWITKLGDRKYKYSFKKGKPVKIKSTWDGRGGYVKFNKKGLVTFERQTKRSKSDKIDGTDVKDRYKYKFDSKGRVSTIIYKSSGSLSKVKLEYGPEVKTGSYKRWLAVIYRCEVNMGGGELDIVQEVTSDEPTFFDPFMMDI